MNRPFGPIALARLMFCAPFVVMLVLMLIEASLSADVSRHDVALQAVAKAGSESVDDAQGP